jgi:hypothetical protein
VSAIGFSLLLSALVWGVIALFGVDCAFEIGISFMAGILFGFGLAAVKGHP